MSDTPFEIESKFEVASAQELATLELLFKSLYAMSGAELQRERNYETLIHYFDTPDFDLENAGVYLRAMDECQPYFKAEICVKTKGTTDAEGTLTREEHNFNVNKNGLDLNVLSENAVALIAPAQGKKLSEIFNTVTRRHDMVKTFEVEGRKIGIDLALDHVDYVDARTGNILRSALEVEVEFKKSFSDASVDRAEATRFVGQIRHELAKHVTLKPIGESRAETGFRLSRALPPAV